MWIRGLPSQIHAQKQANDSNDGNDSNLHTWIKRIIPSPNDKQPVQNAAFILMTLSI